MARRLIDLCILENNGEEKRDVGFVVNGFRFLLPEAGRAPHFLSALYRRDSDLGDIETIRLCHCERQLFLCEDCSQESPLDVLLRSIPFRIYFS